MLILGGFHFMSEKQQSGCLTQTTYVLYRDRVNKRDRTLSFVTPKSIPLRGELILSNYRLLFNAYETHSTDDIEYPLFMISDEEN